VPQCGGWGGGSKVKMSCQHVDFLRDDYHLTCAVAMLTIQLKNFVLLVCSHWIIENVKAPLFKNSVNRQIQCL